MTRLLFGVVLIGSFMMLNLTAWGMGSRVPVEGTAAAEFKLLDLQGTTHSLSQYQGKIVLLNFWATFFFSFVMLQ